MRDYCLNKLFYDVTRSPLGAAYQADRSAVLDRYPLKPEVRKALLEDDLVFVSRAGVNPYLLRYYFQLLGYSDDAVMEKLHTALAPAAGQG